MKYSLIYYSADSGDHFEEGNYVAGFETNLDLSAVMHDIGVLYTKRNWVEPNIVIKNIMPLVV